MMVAGRDREIFTAKQPGLGGSRKGGCLQGCSAVGLGRTRTSRGIKIWMVRERLRSRRSSLSKGTREQSDYVCRQAQGVLPKQNRTVVVEGRGEGLKEVGTDLVIQVSVAFDQPCRDA
jgi:hypothetical protein